MNAHKLQPIELLALDLRIKKYLEMKELIKDLESKCDEIKEELEHQGPCETSYFKVDFVDVMQERAPSLDKLIELYGEDVKRHAKIVAFKKLNIKLK